MRGPRRAAPAAAAALDHRVLLIGDAGYPDPEGEPGLAVLRGEARMRPEATTVVFLGDNVYESGLPDPSPLAGTAPNEILDDVLQALWETRQEAETRLRLQVDAAAPARAVFVPGNHDWGHLVADGWQRIIALERHLAGIAAAENRDVALVPHGGCPGPVTVPVGERLALVVLDTQWWLDDGLGGKPAPGDNPTDCAVVTRDGVVRALERQLVRAGATGRRSVVVAHHPLASRGEHGGFFAWPKHLFPLRMMQAYLPNWLTWLPLPGLGSIMVGVRSCCSPDAQDLPGPENARMREALMDGLEAAAAAGAPALLYAAGHDHSLQLFRGEGGPAYLAVSGLGSRRKASAVGDDARTLFAHSDPDRPGLMRLDVLRDGSVRLAVVEWDPAAERGREVYSRWLAEPLANARSASRPLPTSGSPWASSSVSHSSSQSRP